MPQRYQPVLDLISMAASLLCAVHCLALPLLFTSIPFLELELLENKWIELTGLAVSVILGGRAIVHGFKKWHQSRAILWLFVFGATLLLGSNFGHNLWWEYTTKLGGGVLLFHAHISNWLSCRRIALRPVPTVLKKP